MGYIKGYEHDIFISYCHKDNQKQFDEPIGWIENFYKNLETSLLKLVGSAVTIWWDEKRIDGNTVFNDSIADAVKNSAILLCINSPTYLNSEYCEKELGLFHKENKDRTPGIKVGDRSRILNVLLYNIPRTDWPPEFAGTTGFHFYDAKEKDNKGHPMDMNSEQFKEEFFAFCDSVDKLIKEISFDPALPPPIFDIFFGEVSDNLRDLQTITIDEMEKQTITITDKKTNGELQKQKFEIISDIPPPYEKDEHEAEVNKDLEKVELSVHLLDEVPGKSITREEPVGYPQRQTELSLLTTKPKFIWVPADMNIETVKEKNYKNFLNDLDNNNLPATGYKYVRCLESEVARHVIDMTNKVYDEWLINRGPGRVLLDSHYNDQLFALDAYKKLLTNNVQPVFNPQEGDPKKNESLLEERIRQVCKLIFIYGKISADWITERIKTAKKLVVEKKYPIREFFVLRLPPYHDLDLKNLGQTAIKITVRDNSNSLELDPDILEEILKSLKALV